MDMRKLIFSAFCAMCLAAGCSLPDVGGGDSGELRISFAGKADVASRAGESLPDTSGFRLKVVCSDGKVIYDGLYGACPEALEVAAGNYVVSAMSSEFTKPAFASPQYGDEQCVVVPAGKVADVKLQCRQMNSGVKLNIDKGFLTACPDGVLYLKSPQGKLMYSYSEKRIAYFQPDCISLILSRGSKDEVLVSRTLLAQEIWSLGVSVANEKNTGEGSTAVGDISVSIDTSRHWISDGYVIGGSNGKGSASSDALTVSQALDSIGEEDVWVNGYIVGGDLTSSSASFDAPFQSRTNLVLGPRSSTSDKKSCLSVQLPAGSLRDALNLVDNPSLLGRKVSLKGDIVDAYYGIPGLKNVTEFELQ